MKRKLETILWSLGTVRIYSSALESSPSTSKLLVGLGSGCDEEADAGGSEGVPPLGDDESTPPLGGDESMPPLGGVLAGEGRTGGGAASPLAAVFS